MSQLPPARAVGSSGSDSIQSHGSRRGYLRTVRREIVEWMEEHEWSSLGEMRGNMSLGRIPDPAAYERANFRMALR